MTDRASPEISCPACAATVAAGSNFCRHCGSPLAEGSNAPCPACREVNPGQAHFCHACGASLTSPAQADRRVVTVLFADLSGFTRLSEQLDPEEVRELIADCLDRLARCIAHWGGYVDKFIGDCVMALFGAPVAYENEAERAVRAAIDMQQALGEWSMQHTNALADQEGQAPRLRIGICTGPVVTGLFAGGGALNYTAVGDTVNVAARLERQCEAGRVLVDATSYAQTRHLFEFDDEQVLQVKGRREPVRARHVAGVRAERGKVRGFLGRHTPLVGRAPELDRLRDDWRQAREGAFRVSLISGPAGIGKSRLIEELVSAEGLEDCVALGRSYPYAASTPWEPIAELIVDLFRVPADLPPADAAERVVHAAGGQWPPEQMAGLRIVLGSPIGEATELQPYSAAERSEWMKSAVTRTLQSADDAPRLLVLEDLHWADRTTLEFLAQVPKAELRGPTMLALICRPPLPGEQSLATVIAAVPDRIDLAPLSSEHARDFIEGLLGAHTLPVEFLGQVVERAEGNPLFIEETLKSLLERGALAREDEVWFAKGDLQSFAVPDTIESVLTTRIDGLDNATKSVLQYAAIVGRRFWSGVLADALANRPVDHELERLLQGAFVRAAPFSAVSGDREFLFEHLLLQQVAYEGMLRGFRSELHGLVADWLERRLGGETAEYDEWIAFHYERSAEPERALPFLEDAARGAWGRGSLLDAESLVERALKVASTPTSRAQLIALAEDIATEAGNIERRREAIEQLESIAREHDDSRAAAEAAYREARYELDTGDLSAARSAAERALGLFESLDDISQQGDALRLLGRIAHLWGNYPEALRFYRASLPLERQAGDRYGQAEIFDRLGLVQVDLGSFTMARDYFATARDISVELGDRLTEARVLAHDASALRHLGQYEMAERLARSAVELAEACGSRQAQAAAELDLALILAETGNSAEAGLILQRVTEAARQLGQPALEARACLGLAETQAGREARESARRARELARERGLAHIEILALTREADIDLADGDLEAAERTSVEATELLDLHSSIQGPEELVLYRRGLVLAARGQAREADEYLQRARVIIENRAARIEDPEARESYLNDVPLNRTVLRETDSQLRGKA